MIYLKRGQPNPARQVNVVQQELSLRGIYTGKLDGVYGAATEAAVAEFQARTGLKVDRIVGPITWDRLFPDDSDSDSIERSQPPKDIHKAIPVEMVVQIASKYIGLTEERGNRGPKIDEWLRDLGVPVGNPWCMGFVQGVIKETAKTLGVPDPLRPDTAGCMDLWNRISPKWKKGIQEGRRGDIAIWNHGGGTGHTGIVRGYKAGIYEVIEGNTNDHGGREGVAVCVRRRQYNDPKLMGFVRVPWSGYA